MSRLTSMLRRALRLPGVPEARHVTERAVAPYLRADLTSMHQTSLEHNHRLVHVEQQVAHAVASVDDIQRHMPAVLNAISSTNGTARLLRRETDRLAERIDDLFRHVENLRVMIDTAYQQTQVDLAPHLETMRYLLERVEEVGDEVRADLQPHLDTVGYLLVHQRASTGPQRAVTDQS